MILPKLKAARQRNFKKYYEVCTKYPELIKVSNNNHKADVNWFGFPITVATDKFTRMDMVDFLENRSIQTRNYFSGNILFHKPYSHLCDPYKYPNACKIMDHTFFIGVQPKMSDKMTDYVAQSLDEFLGQI